MAYTPGQIVPMSLVGLKISRDGHKARGDRGILTIAKSQNFKFREGRTTTVLPKGFLLMCVKAMYVRAL